MSGNGDGNDAEAPAPLSNAERQRRFKERRRAERAAAEAEQARAAELKPARGYSWEPFQPGHTRSVTSGIHSERMLMPRAEAILLQAKADPSWPHYLNEPVYAAAVSAWARAEAAVQLYTEYLEGQTPEEWSTEVTDLAEATEGDGDRGGSSTRTSRSRKRMASLEMWRKLEQHASQMRTKLGLDPLARARLGRDVASQQADMAQVMAQLAREDQAAS